MCFDSTVPYFKPEQLNTLIESGVLRTVVCAARSHDTTRRLGALLTPAQISVLRLRQLSNLDSFEPRPEFNRRLTRIRMSVRLPRGSQLVPQTLPTGSQGRELDCIPVMNKVGKVEE